MSFVPRSLRGALGTVVVSACLVGGISLPANASVSFEMSVESLVAQAVGVAIATPIQKTSVWQDGRIVTYTQLSTDDRISGVVETQTWVRSYGGEVDGIGQIVEGEPEFTKGKPCLVFLKKHQQGFFEIVGRGQGLFGVQLDAAQAPRISPRVLSWVVKKPDHALSRALRTANWERRPVSEVAAEIRTFWSEAHAK